MLPAVIRVYLNPSTCSEIQNSKEELDRHAAAGYFPLPADSHLAANFVPPTPAAPATTETSGGQGENLQLNPEGKLEQTPVTTSVGSEEPAKDFPVVPPAPEAPVSTPAAEPEKPAAPAATQEPAKPVTEGPKAAGKPGKASQG